MRSITFADNEGNAYELRIIYEPKLDGTLFDPGVHVTDANTILCNAQAFKYLFNLPVGKEMKLYIDSFAKMNYSEADELYEKLSGNNMIGITSGPIIKK